MGLTIFTLPLLYLMLRFSKNIILSLEKKRKNKFYSKVSNIIITLLEQLNNFNTRPLSIIYCWIISLISHMLMLISFYYVAHIININILGFTEIFYSGSLSLILNIVPLTPGGIGIGESVFNYFASTFDTHGTEKIIFGSIFFLAYRVLFAFVCFTGGLTFILLKKPLKEYKNTKK